MQPYQACLEIYVKYFSANIRAQSPQYPLFLVVQQLDQERNILVRKRDSLCRSYCGTMPSGGVGERDRSSTGKFSTDPLPDVDDTIGAGASGDGLSGSYTIPPFAIVAEVVIHGIAAEPNLVLVAVSAPRVKAMHACE
jgi:hypothetical protein